MRPHLACVMGSQPLWQALVLEVTQDLAQVVLPDGNRTEVNVRDVRQAP